MADRYTTQAREALRLAEKAAFELNHSYVGSEHLLVGLIQEGSGVAAKVLEANGVTPDRVLELIDRLISGGYNVAMEDKQEYSPMAVKILQNAYKEAVRYKAQLIGTEHILIAIIKDANCIASKLLHTININIQKVYTEILGAMGEDAVRGSKEQGYAKEDSSPTPPWIAIPGT